MHLFSQDKPKRLCVAFNGELIKLSATELADILHITLQHAHSFIRDPSKVRRPFQDLIAFKVFRQIPGWPPGFEFRNGGIHTPTGKFVNHEQISQIEYIYSLVPQVTRIEKEVSDCDPSILLREQRYLKGIE